MLGASDRGHHQPLRKRSGFRRGADFDSPWGWMPQGGFTTTTSWHMAFTFGLRYTGVHYTFAGQTIDASNIGLDLTFHVNL